MSKSEENRKNLKIKLLEARLKSYYTRLQRVHEVALQINESSSSEVQSFLENARPRNLENLRREFNEEFDELTLIKMELYEDYEPDMTGLEKFENMFITIKNKAETLSRKTEMNNEHHNKGSASAHKIKLPKIELAKFGGDPKAWRLFIECYNSLIHNNDELSASEKVYYLCGQLSGRALDTVAGITPTGENYALIYDTLVGKYEDVRQIGTSYLDEILNLKKIQQPSVDNLNNFIDKFSVSVAAFQKLDIPQKLDFVFLHLALKRVDTDTARLFEGSVRDQKLPSYESFAKFVKEQAKIYQRTGGVPYHTAGTKSSAPNRGVSRALHTSQNDTNCPLCQGDHTLFSQCQEFLKLAPKQRFEAVKEHQGCARCLTSQHKSSKCSIQKKCERCNSVKHNTLLHFGNKASTSLPISSGDNEVMETESEEEEEESVEEVTLCSMQGQVPYSVNQEVKNTVVLLATARIQVKDSTGNTQIVRCLIDSGSQNHFVTEKCCKRLGLNSQILKAPMSVNGFGGGSNPILGATEMEFSSLHEKHSYKIRPLIVKSITSKLPAVNIDTAQLHHLKGIPLADALFDRPGQIDMLIGAQLFSKIIRSRRIFGSSGKPDALDTTLGYVLMGDAPVLGPVVQKQTTAFCAFTGERLDGIVKRFWELEEVPSCNASLLSREEQECEEIYKSTTTRDATGRYTVALPFKSDATELGNSIPVAEKRFSALERKMKAAPQLKDAYDGVIEDYLRNDYISPVSDINVDPAGYVIPHHGVIRNDKVTSKLRVVMDASARTDRNISLNQTLHTGPNLQKDIFSILLNFRLFPVAFCADVKQMYLQIKIADHHKKYLRILYRFNQQGKLQQYEFQRLCFGLSVSPFLALRTIRQLSEDENHNFPQAVKVVQRDLYMDDIVSSEKSTSTAAEVALQLISLFKAGGFDLVKWTSNTEDLLALLPASHLHPHVIKFDTDSGQKILGVKWDPKSDVFSFDLTPCKEICTKRSILSAIARLWDILGFAAPVILYAKLIIQELWQLKIDWDAVPPESVSEKWSKFQEELPLLAKMSIPRHIGVVDGAEVTLVGFSDASERAYGAVAYFHIKTSQGVEVNLLCAKSKVAPLKSITLARLELCGALLLAKLIKIVLRSYEGRCNVPRIFAFTDSTTTLHWIYGSPHRWKTFVANRVAQIQEILDPKCFYHVSGKDNPSDCLSRGLTPAQLMEHRLWLKGPLWISQDVNTWPIEPFKPSNWDIPESKAVVVLAAQNNDTYVSKPLIYQLAQRISSWSKLLRIVVYILRFTRKLEPCGSIISAEDLNKAELTVIRALQHVYFSDTIEALRAGRSCPKALQKLRPFLVDDIVRVGGRLDEADLTFDHKHPMLLPHKDHIVNLIVSHTHRINCHTGPHVLHSILRQRFWILSGRNVVRKMVHMCNRCFRTRPKSCTPPVMADLPQCRLQISKPFANTGVDYCGPFNITLTRRRGVRSQKAYICVFLCLTTRAVHIELANDLSTEAFLNAFKRFLSRRGPIQKIMSDHGTNFIGARSYLKDLQSVLSSNEYVQKWGFEMSNHRIKWEMIPPNAPHFGGGWESTVNP